MDSLLDLLRSAADSVPSKKLFFYSSEGASSITYSELNERATENAKALVSQIRLQAGQTVLVHLDSQASYVIWFWSVIAAGAIPVISTPLPTDAVARDRHCQHLGTLLDRPVVLTTRSLVDELSGLSSACMVFTDELLPLPGSLITQEERVQNGSNGHHTHSHEKPAFLMLTSGSTGGAKAVGISHTQVRAAIAGKMMLLGTSDRDTFLNWIGPHTMVMLSRQLTIVGFDHVACVTEIHLHALAAHATQIHVESRMVMEDPLLWLNRLAAHSATYTFAPNFFLASVCKAVQSHNDSSLTYGLSALRLVISGGEANSVSTAMEFNRVIRAMGASSDVVCPAFGMTETCAGSIYNLSFPDTELQSGLNFCAVGRPTQSMQIRITAGEGEAVPCGQTGNLELHGSAVFHEYYHGTANTTQSFTHDGWFKTGDTGYLDSQNNLILNGRTKDTIIINGVKYFSHEVESAVEGAAGGKLARSWTSAFSTWPKGSDSEEVVITFLASDEVRDDGELSMTLDDIAQAAFLYCSKRPIAMIPLPAKLLRKSSLGKLSRTGIKAAYEAGQFDKYLEETTLRVQAHKRRTRVAPSTDMEKRLARIFAQEFQLDLELVGVDDSLIDFGVDSIRLLRFRGLLQQQLDLGYDIPIGILLTNPSIRGLSVTLSASSHVRAYNPVVVLQSGSSDSSPIWFIHPGLGEVLVFVNISQYFSNRHVYALRAPGFNPGEEMFTSIDQMTDVYVEAIRQKQSHGPYVLIGYSFGSMIAFETSKKLEAAGHEVFMGSLNGPPHIKWRMVQIDWVELFLNLSYFLGFLTEEEAVLRSAEYHEAGYTKEQVLSKIMAIAPRQTLENLDLDQQKLARWADISASLQGLAHNYDPFGTIKHIDVFYANPLLAVGRDKSQWLSKHLHAWNDFSSQPTRFHDSPGAHYTMLSPEHVFVMQKVIRAALLDRGVL